MNVLVTGADGFIGSHLTERLLEDGHLVKALSQYNSFNYWGWLNDIRHPNLEIVSGDVRDPAFCNTLTQGVDLVYHLAALIAIPYSYVAPQSYVETNISGTLNICEAVKNSNVQRLLVTSTSEVYGTAQFVPITEEHPKQSQSPYSASKIGADAIAMSYYNSFDLPLTIVRPFNTYGPRQSARAIIPTIISQIAEGHKEIKVGDGTPTRDFTFVKDTCSGFIELAECEESIGLEVNISMNEEISIHDLQQLIAKLMEAQVNFVEDQQRIRPSKSEVFRLKGDNSLINKLTKFKPSYSLEDGLKETIQWFSDPQNLANYKASIYNK